MYTMKRRSLVNSAAPRRVRQRSAPSSSSSSSSSSSAPTQAPSPLPPGPYNINRRLGTTVGNYYLPPDVTDIINEYVPRGYFGLPVPNIQGLAPNRQTIHPFGTNNNEPIPADSHWGHLYPGHHTHMESSIQPIDEDTDPRSLTSPPNPHLRGPGGKKRGGALGSDPATWSPIHGGAIDKFIHTHTKPKHLVSRKRMKDASSSLRSKLRGLGCCM